MIEELKKKHLDSILEIDENNDIDIGNGIPDWVFDKKAKEATNISISFAIEVLKNLKPENNAIQTINLLVVNKIQELTKLIEK